MNTEKPMSILLIEDDELEVKEFLEYLKTRNDAEIIKHTNSSDTIAECKILKL